MNYHLSRTVRSGTVLFALASLCLSWSGTARAVSVDDFVPRRYTNSTGVLLYRLFIPTNYTAAQRFPLVLFMHGAGERGNDNRNQLVGQTGELVFASETNQLKYPSFMVAPQCPSDASWTDTNIRLRVLGLMTALQAEFSIDADRLYVTGLSLGGFGTWDYIGRYPGMYAAAIPMSGADTTGPANSSRVKIPIWNFHAANDDTVNVSGSRTIIDSLRRSGGNPIYTEYAAGGHVIWTPAYHTPILMDWVYSQRRGAPVTLPPLLTINAPTAESIYAAADSVLNLSGTANDGAVGPTNVTWASYRTSATSVLNGSANGTTNWSITNLTLFPTYTNVIVVKGSGTSWSTSLRGNTTFNKTLKIIFPPFITTQPSGQMVNEGDLAQFSVTPNPVAPSPQFQWRLSGTNIAGATASSLSLANVQLANAGPYSVQISNQFGAVISSDAVLAVNRFPVAQCADVIVSAGPGCQAGGLVDHGSFDPDGDPLTLSQSPPGPYPLGTNLVALTVTDSHGASDVCSALVIVLDRTPPTIVCPPDLVVTNAHDQLNSVVAFSATASDDCSSVGLALCVPPSGSIFGLGSHSVVCSAADAAGNATQCSFNVTVWPGNVPPVAVIEVSPLVHFQGYTNLIAISPDNREATLVFDASKSYDLDDTNFNYFWYTGTNLFSTNAVARRTLSLGTHEITLALDDTFPLGASRTNVIVEVITASDAVTILIGLVQDSILSARSQQPLLASLDAAAAAFDRGNTTAGNNQLQAFQNKLRAQVIPFDAALASELTRAAQEVIDGVDWSVVP